jgi:outer membrane receptor protein involved in Fe transport
LLPRSLIRIRLALLATLTLCFGASTAWAGITGKISGRLVDADGKPIAAATIHLVGSKLGAYSDVEGRYTIFNVPPGTYELRIKRLGFSTLVIQEVVISADQTTTLESELAEALIEAEEVVITAERPPVDLKLTSSQSNVTTEEIELLPVQNLQEIVNLQAGVVEGHFRGGRLGEVQFQVDGVTINNPYDNSSSMSLDRSLLQEVQVISGTFDAEYGQAMSGVVNAVLKDGTDEFEWSAEAFTGAFVFPGNDKRLTDDTIRPGGIQNYQLSASGPLHFADVTYFLSGRRYVFDDYVVGTRVFLPTDDSDTQSHVFQPSGDGDEVALGFSREWSGVAKLTSRHFESAKLSYQMLWNGFPPFRILGVGKRIDLGLENESRRSNYAFRFNPDGLSKQTTSSISHGLDWTQTFGRSTFLDLSVRQNIFSYEDFAYDSVSDPRYDRAGEPDEDLTYAPGAIIEGVELTRFTQKTDNYIFKSSLSSQVTAEHQVKVGSELQLPGVEFGAPGHLSLTGGELTRHFNEPPGFPPVRDYFPRFASGFVQDVVELPDLIVRAGLRTDYFDARALVPSDPRNPANAISGAPKSILQKTTAKTVWSPRVGVAYPIEDRAAVHFSYGHFYQYPSLNDLFSNADYEVLENLQAGDGGKYGVLGNPDVRPEQTVQYEIGYKHALSDDLGIDITSFYKDIRDLLGVEFVTTYTGAEYYRFTNTDFGNVFGFTTSVDHRRLGPFSASVDYTWQQALGNASDPRETATRAEAGEDPRPRLAPFNWDQRHTLNATLSLQKPGEYSVSAILRAASGQPYTPIIGAGGFGNGLIENSGRKPMGAIVDLRAEKSLSAMGKSINVFARIFNIFDARYFNGSVFSSTGSPDYSRFPKEDELRLLDPNRFYPPRRIEIGIRLRLEAP